MIDVSGVTNLPANRGALRAVLSADRARVNRRGTIAFMADVRFERPAPAQSYPVPNGGDGDFVDLTGVTALTMSIRLLPRDRTEPQRDLVVPPVALPPKPPQVPFARTHELSLAALLETDGSPARLSAGDVVVLTLSGPLSGNIEARFWNSELNVASSSVTISRAGSLSLSLRFTLTDEPVVEPPQALYAALVRSQTALCLPFTHSHRFPGVSISGTSSRFQNWSHSPLRNLCVDAFEAAHEYGIHEEKKLATIAAHIVKMTATANCTFPTGTKNFRP